MRALWSCAALVLAIAGCDRPQEADIRQAFPAEADSANPAECLPSEAPTEDVLLVRESACVRRGEPLDAVLRRLDVEAAQRALVARALASEVDLRRILPGETVEVAHDEDRVLREVVLERDLLTRVRVGLSPEGEASVETLVREPEIYVRRLEGRIEDSLYEDMLSAGADANLVMRYADLLAWEVDFFTEPRAGDRVCIVVEEKRLDGEVLGFGRILAAEYAGERASSRAIRYVDEAGNLDWYDDSGRSVRRAFLKSPLSYRRISSYFSARRRHPILKRVMPHWGVDYVAPQGTPVSALGAGVVTFAGRRGGYGNYVEIRHNSTYTTCYGHLSKFGRGIRRGVRVEQGDVIGAVGATGLATGPHLDFRVKKNGSFVNPLRIESPAGRSVPETEKSRFELYRDGIWRLAEELPLGCAVPLAEAWGVFPERVVREWRAFTAT
jgi:murein DD-endopeptidase MepM/ murein hydrolase activator NlpD